MNFKIKGKITLIGEVQSFDSGAKKLIFNIDTGEKYDNIYSFEFFKNKDNAKYVENFGTECTVGDIVSVEFNIKCREYKDKYYTNLSAWKVNTSEVEVEPNADQMGDDTEGDDDNLPF